MDEVTLPRSRPCPTPVVNTSRSLPPGDPFALLQPYQTVDPLEDWEISYRFAQLKMRVDKCHRERLALRINAIKGIGGRKAIEAKCNLCKDNLPTPMSVLDHCLSDKHVDAMNGAVCADAFIFWWRVVQEATIAEQEPIDMTPSPRSDPFPYVSPPPGVDPLALLKSCEGARRKMPANEIAIRFPELLARFGLCDSKLLMMQIAVDFDTSKFKKCAFCEEDVVFSTMIEHICSWMHIKAMNGAVCADAFDFWWNAVEAAIPADRLSTIPFVPESARWPQPTSDIVKLTLTPRQGVDPSALLRSCEGAARKMPTAEISASFKKLKLVYDACDKQCIQKVAIAVLPRTVGCALCDDGELDRFDAIEHFCGVDHLDMMSGDVCADAFDFWWNAVEEATAVPQICPPPNVDPFALLQSCRTRFPLMHEDAIDRNFNMLRIGYSLCDKKRLAQQTSSLFEKLRLSGVKGCTLCKKYVTSVDDMITHICDLSHINKTYEKVYLPAFTFWWNAVESATVKEIQAVPQITPPPYVDPFALLGPCHGRRPLMYEDLIESRFKGLFYRFRRCNVKKLTEQTRSLFEKRRQAGIKECALCGNIVTTVSAMIGHICGNGHIEKMGGVVDLHAFNFWSRAVESVTDLDSEPEIQKQPANGKKPEPAAQKKPANGKKPKPAAQKKPANGKKPEPAAQKKPV